MGELSVGILGSFRLEGADGKPVVLSAKKAKALLAYLALNRGRPQLRTKLSALLWEDSDEPRARESLRQTLSLLRKALSPAHAGALVGQQDSLAFDSTAINVDVIEFERLVASGEPAHLDKATLLYRGDLLEGFDIRASEFESWLAMERQRLKEQALAALEKLLAHHVASNAGEAGITVATRLIALDPLRESAHRSLMQLYCKQGHHAAALRQFRICAETLKKELGVEPDAATRALYREIRDQRNAPRNGATNPAPEAALASGRAEPAYRAELPGGPPPPSPAVPLPDKPSIAVLPFENMSGDPEQEYFADGMVDEIITALSRFPNLFVIARNSSFTYKGRAVDVKQIGRELGVRYVLEGSVRKASNRLRIIGQLIEAATGSHIWADRFDGVLEDIFDLQDRLTESVVGQLARKLQQAEIARATRKPTESLDAYDHYLRGIASYRRYTKEATVEALRLFHLAIELDPVYAAAYAMAAICYVNLKVNGWTIDGDASAETATLCERALELGRDDAVALCYAGFALGYVVGDLDGGVAFVDRATAINPNLAAAWYYSGWLQVFLGRPKVAIAALTRAMRLNPLDSSIGLAQTATAFAYFLDGRYDDSRAWADKAVREAPYFPLAWLIATATTALVGRSHEVEKVLASARQLHNMARISTLRHLIPVRWPRDLAKIEEGLRKAGLPE